MSADVLRITGEVRASTAMTASDLAALPSVVANVSAVADGARGRAVRVAEVLDRARVDATATHCTVISEGGGYRAAIPLPTLLAGGWLAFELDGKPLPDSLGGPFRLTVAEGSTLCWNVKRVATLRLTVGAEPDDVPENPPH